MDIGFVLKLLAATFVGFIVELLILKFLGLPQPLG